MYSGGEFNIPGVIISAHARQEKGLSAKKRASLSLAKPRW
jgi:hypothetical protein